MRTVLAILIVMLSLDAERWPAVSWFNRAMAFALPLLAVFSLRGRILRTKLLLTRHLPWYALFAFWAMFSSVLTHKPFAFSVFVSVSIVLLTSLSALTLFSRYGGRDLPGQVRALYLVCLACALFLVADSRLGLTRGWYLTSTASVRYRSFFANPNSASLVAFLAAALSFFYFTQAPKLRLKLLYGAVIAASLAGIVATGSRSGMVMVAVFGLPYGLMSFRSASLRSRLLFAGAFVAVVAAGLFLVEDGALGDAWARLAQRQTNYRLETWAAALDIVQEQGYLVGGGFGQDARILARHGLGLFAPDSMLGSHSFYVALLLETGVVGALIGVGIVAMPFARLCRWRSRAGDLTPLVNLVLCVCLAYAVRAAVEVTLLRFGFAFMSFLWFVVVGEMLVMEIQVRQGEALEVRRSPAKGAGAWGLSHDFGEARVLSEGMGGGC